METFLKPSSISSLCQPAPSIIITACLPLAVACDICAKLLYFAGQTSLHLEARYRLDLNQHDQGA